MYRAVDFDDWMRLDMQILLRTVPVVLTAPGARSFDPKRGVSHSKP